MYNWPTVTYSIQSVNIYKWCYSIMFMNDSVVRLKSLEVFIVDYFIQADVYDTCVEPLVKSCMEGYNATVFAYGQTVSVVWTCKLF